MSEGNQSDFGSMVSARVKLFVELINDKNSQLNTMIENLKRLDGYALGSKESIDKIEKHIKQQKSELASLVEQNKIPKEVATLIESVLNNMMLFAKNVSLDAERLFYSKQGEMVFLKSDIEKLVKLKASHESALSKKQEEKAQQEKTVVSETKENKQKTRPDKNPNTKIGKAAIDIAERKKKILETVKEIKEGSGKRGRKPKSV